MEASTDPNTDLLLLHTKQIHIHAKQYETGFEQLREQYETERAQYIMTEEWNDRIMKDQWQTYSEAQTQYRRDWIEKNKQLHHNYIAAMHRVWEKDDIGTEDRKSTKDTCCKQMKSRRAVQEGNEAVNLCEMELGGELHGAFREIKNCMEALETVGDRLHSVTLMMSELLKKRKQCQQPLAESNLESNLESEGEQNQVRVQTCKRQNNTQSNLESKKQTNKEVEGGR